MYNLVEVCNYGDSKDRIIRDILFNGCASRSARDKIIRVGDKIKLAEVLEILHSEDAVGATHESIKEIDHYNSNFSSNPVAQVHYASYEKNQKSRKKTSTEQITDSTNSKRLCYRCGEPYSKEHEPKCRAQNATCNACGKKGHFQKVCRTTGKQKSSSTKKAYVHTVQTISSDGYYNETGDWVPAIPSSFRPSNIASVNTLSAVSDSQIPFRKPRRFLTSREPNFYFYFYSSREPSFYFYRSQNSMRVIRRSNLFNRNQLKLQFLPSYRFLKDLQEFKTFNNLSTLQILMQTQMQILTTRKFQVSIFRRILEIPVQMFFKEREK